VLICVEEDYRIAQDVHCVCIPEQVWALLMVVLAKALHDAVDFLSLSRQPEALKIQSDGHVEGKPCTPNDPSLIMPDLPHAMSCSKSVFF